MIALAVNGKTISVNNATILGINSTFPLILDSSNVEATHPQAYFYNYVSEFMYWNCGAWNGPYYPQGCNLLGRTAEFKLKQTVNNTYEFRMFYYCYGEIQQYDPILACNAIAACEPVIVPSGTLSSAVFTVPLTDNYLLNTYSDVGWQLLAFFGAYTQDKHHDGERITDYIDYIKIV